VRRRQANRRERIRPLEERTHLEVDIEFFEFENGSAVAVKERKVFDRDRKCERIYAEPADDNRASRLFGQGLNDYGPDDGRNDKETGDRVERQQSGGDKYEFLSPDVLPFYSVTIWSAWHGVPE